MRLNLRTVELSFVVFILSLDLVLKGFRQLQALLVPLQPLHPLPVGASPASTTAATATAASTATKSTSTASAAAPSTSATAPTATPAASSLHLFSRAKARTHAGGAAPFFVQFLISFLFPLTQEIIQEIHGRLAMIAGPRTPNT